MVCSLVGRWEGILMKALLREGMLLCWYTDGFVGGVVCRERGVVVFGDLRFVERLVRVRRRVLVSRTSWGRGGMREKMGCPRNLSGLRMSCRLESARISRMCENRCCGSCQLGSPVEDGSNSKLSVVLGFRESGP